MEWPIRKSGVGVEVGGWAREVMKEFMSERTWDVGPVRPRSEGFETEPAGG